MTLRELLANICGKKDEKGLILIYMIEEGFLAMVTFIVNAKKISRTSIAEGERRMSDYQEYRWGGGVVCGMACETPAIITPIPLLLLSLLLLLSILLL